MSSDSQNARGSMLLVEECFAMQDAGFLEALRRIASPKLLAAFAERWKKDQRPWAREKIFAYLDLPLNCPGHQPLVKRLFKDAEERKDDELMAAFLVAFNTLVRRVRRERWHWDYTTRNSYKEQYLATKRDVIPLKLTTSGRNPATGELITISRGAKAIRGGRLFSYRTRYYLRRRAWRYFRWLGYARPAAFPSAIANALRRYSDADLAAGENILDSWALLNICFRGSDALEFRPDHLRLKEGRTLSELRATPRFRHAWETPDGARVLFELATKAKAHLVRVWAMELLRSLQGSVALEVSIEEISALLNHDDEEVQRLGAELFELHPDLDKLPVTTWLRLLGTRNLVALATLCAAFSRHVSAERLTLAQCVELACVQPVPVARLGQQFLTARKLTLNDIPILGSLADARCPAVAGELTSWALQHLGIPERYDREVVSRFFDSLTQETRKAAWTWLISNSPGYNDAVLWSRLAETPFDDLRLKLIDHLAVRVKVPKISADGLAPVWCAVLLGVHRGGRQKLKAVRQIADAIARETGRAEELLPVLLVAVRSIRGPEMRAGLAAVMSLIAIRPELDASVRARIPELQFEPMEVHA